MFVAQRLWSLVVLSPFQVVLTVAHDEHDLDDFVHLLREGVGEVSSQNTHSALLRV